ncbi:uncharacterized protein LOC116432698 [Nomia melanderi]|uniref:uncharacterized protein LOC116432698 n=1 Tax=Nomia melanderi TaxID=2448451 RepID=UPI001303F5B2|nr:zinc finger protein 26-like [Nomia melanderi]
MDFSGNNVIQGIIPQFADLTPRSNSDSTAKFTSGDTIQDEHTTVYTTSTTGSNQPKQTLLVNSPNKYTGPILAWPDPNTLMQLCEKQGIQAINIPNYNQNNSILGVQSNSLPVRIIPNMYLPSTSQPENNKSIMDTGTEAETKTSAMQESQVQLQQQSAMAEYFQKLQATTLPLTLQQLIKLQTEQVKKEKTEEEKVEYTQNNILNIPSVPVFRNNQLQNGTSFMSSDQMMASINPNDLNVHMDSHQENENIVHSMKVEQQVQTDSPKTERKMKFRAKTGEIKITVALDGSTLYCCPECNLAFSDKVEIDQHIQAHIQERKYQCKECGAMLKRKEHLDQHMRGHSDERPFKCPVCQKGFKRNEHLTRHYVIHSGDKNFTCSVCQKAFSRKDHLNKHTQTHSGIRRNRTKKDTFFIEQKESFDKINDISAMSKQEVNFVLKDGFIKQEPTFLQYIQNLQKDQNLIHTFSSFKEQAMKEANVLQQQAVNMNEILPQNTSMGHVWIIT